MRKSLLVTGRENPCEGLDKATRVLMKKKFCGFMRVEDVRVYHLLKWPRVVMDLEAVQFLENKLTKSNVLPVSFPEVTSSKRSAKTASQVVSPELLASTSSSSEATPSL
jgi:hypothetical protein